MRTVARHHEEKRQREERGRRDAQTRLRRIAASAAREIEYFWSNIEQVGAGLFVGPENLGVGAGEPSATGAVAQCPRRRSDALGRLAPQRAGASVSVHAQKRASRTHVREAQGSSAPPVQRVAGGACLREAPASRFAFLKHSRLTTR